MALEQLGQRGGDQCVAGAVAGKLVGLGGNLSSPRSAGNWPISVWLGAVIERDPQSHGVANDSVEPAVLPSPATGPPVACLLHTPTYEPPTKGHSQNQRAAGNSVLRETGGWRTFRPVLIADKCNGCWLCFAYCPDGVIAMNRTIIRLWTMPIAKGVRSASIECPTHALVAEREKEGGVAWTAK